MRVGHTYVSSSKSRSCAHQPRRQRRRLRGDDGLRGFSFQTREEFLAYCDEPWRLEVHAALADLLERERTVLSVGAGSASTSCRYTSTATTSSRRTFLATPWRADEALPGVSHHAVDVFAPTARRRYDDVLAAAMESVFDDDDLRRAIINLRRLH